MKEREKIILVAIGGAVLVALYTISQTDTTKVGTTLAQDIGFIGLVVVVILALVFLPIGI